jgi:predicted AAA+ superfamily ATPase
MTNESIDTNQIFKHPFACLVSGPSRSGKSTLVLKIIEQHLDLIDKK